MKRLSTTARYSLFFLFAMGAFCLPISAQVFSSNGIYYNVMDGASKEVAVTYNEANCSYLEDSYGEPFCNDYEGHVSVPDVVSHNGAIYRVTAVGYSALKNCTSLTSIELPIGIRGISDEAFANCTNLANITLKSSFPPEIDEDGEVFAPNVLSSALVVVPKGTLSRYRKASGWRGFARIVEQGVTLLGDANCDNTIDVADVMGIVNNILGNRPPIFIFDNADVDRNGVVDVADAMRVVYIILEKE